MKAARRAYHVMAGLLSWAVFTGVGLLLNLVCAPLLLFPGRRRLGGAVRRIISSLFGAWCRWLHATRLIYVTWRGFTAEALAGPAIYISNHPGLLDATFILARLPDAICIFKPTLIRNPAIGPAAIMAGYAAGTSGIDLIRDVAERVASGRSLLIFPEGRRTPTGALLGPLKPGFALIARRANAPVRMIAVRSPRDLFPRGRTWWNIPPLPARIEVILLGELPLDDGAHTAELTARAAQQLSAAIAPP